MFTIFGMGNCNYLSYSRGFTKYETYEAYMPKIRKAFCKFGNVYCIIRKDIMAAVVCIERTVHSTPRLTYPTPYVIFLSSSKSTVRETQNYTSDVVAGIIVKKCKFRACK